MTVERIIEIRDNIIQQKFNFKADIMENQIELGNIVQRKWDFDVDQMEFCGCEEPRQLRVDDDTCVRCRKQINFKLRAEKKYGKTPKILPDSNCLF